MKKVWMTFLCCISKEFHCHFQFLCPDFAWSRKWSVFINHDFHGRGVKNREKIPWWKLPQWVAKKCFTTSINFAFFVFYFVPASLLDQVLSQGRKLFMTLSDFCRQKSVGVFCQNFRGRNSLTPHGGESFLVTRVLGFFPKWWRGHLKRGFSLNHYPHIMRFKRTFSDM